MARCTYVFPLPPSGRQYRIKWLGIHWILAFSNASTRSGHHRSNHSADQRASPLQTPTMQQPPSPVSFSSRVAPLSQSISNTHQYSPTEMAPRRQQCHPNAFPAWCVFVVLLRMGAAPESDNSICAFQRRNETERHEEILPLWTRNRNPPAQAEVFSPSVPMQISQVRL